MLFTQVGKGYEDERVFVEEYFTYMNEDGSWLDWTACTAENQDERFSLLFRVGQPIKVKIVFRAQINCTVDLKITEIGDYAYDVLEGAEHYKNVGYVVIPEGTDTSKVKDTVVRPNQLIEYVWVLQPNRRYASSGWSRVSLDYFWQVSFFEKAKVTDTVQGIASFFNAYIRDEWNGPSYQPSGFSNDSNLVDSENQISGNRIPGFDIPLLFSSYIVLYFIIKRKRYNTLP